MRVLLVGDSEAGAVQPYLSSVLRPGETAFVSSVVGSRIEAWSNGQITTAIVNAKPDVVVVFLGTNNYYDTTAPNLAPIFAQLPARSVWVGPTSVQGKSWPIDGWLRTAVAARGIPYVDTESLGIPLRDGVHPTPAGAVTWLKTIWPIVEATYAVPIGTSPLLAYGALAAAIGIWGYLLLRGRR
jgi:hypothetical protein